jgi:hypothetical protein
MSEYIFGFQEGIVPYARLYREDVKAFEILLQKVLLPEQYAILEAMRQMRKAVIETLDAKTL